MTELFHSHQFLSGIDDDIYVNDGKYIAASCIFRGSLNNAYNIRLNEWEMVNGLRFVCLLTSSKQDNDALQNEQENNERNQ